MVLPLATDFPAQFGDCDRAGLEREPPRRTQLLEQRLRRVKTLSDDPDLGEMATELLRALRLFS